MDEDRFLILLDLNARFQPVNRFDLEDALSAIFEKFELGEVGGGGTLCAANGEVEGCDIDLEIEKEKVENNIERAFDVLAGILNKLGIPKGSKLVCGESEREVGNLEGLAFYANGRELPKEVYATCDINFVIEQMDLCMEGVGRYYSYWEGPTETALYFYGSSFEEMQECIARFVQEYPLCQKSRIVQIA
ncbi:MAG: hypothetical protein IJ379_03210 [Lachnospiraceae bacterium]|nr:hypothetical protein [Lachnospiraceae bacterium]